MTFPTALGGPAAWSKRASPSLGPGPKTWPTTPPGPCPDGRRAYPAGPRTARTARLRLAELSQSVFQACLLLPAICGKDETPVLNFGHLPAFDSSPSGLA